MEMSNFLSSDFKPLSLSGGETSQTHRNPKKKRTKYSNAADSHKLHPSMKPDPTAPKITRPCTECGKKFWSWKALFGHMRCHPERQWRGINPPRNLQRGSLAAAPAGEVEAESSSLTEEDHEVAACLLMMSCGQPAADLSLENFSDSAAGVGYSGDEHVIDSADGPSTGRFECSSCKKVFGSHQALGGHRASHKNVKGCYAITKNDGEDDVGVGVGSGCCSGGDPTAATVSGHKCGICLRVFSSGQALGGHTRCHWEEKPVGLGLDLNLTTEDEGDEDSGRNLIGGLTLDLRLGL